MTRKRALIYAIILIFEVVALLSVIPASSPSAPKSDNTTEINLDHALIQDLLHADHSMRIYCNGDASLEMLADGGSDIIGTCPSVPGTIPIPR